MKQKGPVHTQRAMAQAVRDAYTRGEEDEALEPLALFDRDGRPVGRIQDRD